MSNNDEYVDIYSPYYQPEEEPSPLDTVYQANEDIYSPFFIPEPSVFPEYTSDPQETRFLAGYDPNQTPTIIENEGMGSFEIPSFMSSLLTTAKGIIPSFFSATLNKIFPETEQANPVQEAPSEARYLKPYSTMKGAIQASYETLTKSLPSGIFIYVIIGAIGLFLFFFLKKR